MSGCSSDTIGMSNLLSDIIESMCCAIEDPYEVISSEDMLSRFEKFNSWVKSERENAKSVKEQVKKIYLEWLNIDDQWLRLYIHLNRDLCSDISEIAHLLPHKRKGRPGKESGMGSKECGERHVRGNEKESCWTWPEKIVTRRDLKALIGIALEISVKFFFNNFTYLQCKYTNSVLFSDLITNKLFF